MTALTQPRATTVYYHGGKAGLMRGALLVPSPPHVTDGCPICVARASGGAVTVGEYRAWLQSLGDRAAPILKQLADAPDDGIIDPPTQSESVYCTTEQDYAMWYAARSGHGDLYEVEPVGEIVSSSEDHFMTVTAKAARVVRVLRRGVWLTRKDRRRIQRLWRRADKDAGVLT